MSRAWASSGDLTAKARIRNAALELYGATGESATTIRAIAEAAGVTPGLVLHHFGSKDGLGKAVAQLVADWFVGVLEDVPMVGSASEITAARDASVAAMLQQHPELVAYLRRAILESNPAGTELLERLMDITLDQVRALHAAGIGSAKTSDTARAISILMRQIGRLVLAPTLEQIWIYSGGASTDPPGINVTLET